MLFVLINVTVKPRMKEFSNVTVNENEIAVLTCEVNADPAAEISFTRVEPYAKFNKGDNVRKLLTTFRTRPMETTLAQILVSNRELCHAELLI